MTQPLGTWRANCLPSCRRIFFESKSLILFQGGLRTGVTTTSFSGKCIFVYISVFQLISTCHEYIGDITQSQMISFLSKKRYHLKGKNTLLESFFTSKFATHIHSKFKFGSFRPTQCAASIVKGKFKKQPKKPYNCTISLS